VALRNYRQYDWLLRIIASRPSASVIPTRSGQIEQAYQDFLSNLPGTYPAPPAPRWRQAVGGRLPGQPAGRGDLDQGSWRGELATPAETRSDTLSVTRTLRRNQRDVQHANLLLSGIMNTYGCGTGRPDTGMEPRTQWCGPCTAKTARRPTRCILGPGQSSAELDGLTFCSGVRLV